MRRKIKILLVLAFVTILLIVLISWWASSVSPADVRAYSLEDLRSVEICRNCKCAELESSLWPELIQKVINLKFTIGTGGRGEESQDLYEIKFDWGKNGKFGLRLWTRPSLNGHILATFQSKHQSGVAYYGDYSGDELKSLIDELVQPEKMIKRLCRLPGRQHNNSLNWTRNSATFHHPH